MKIGIITPIGPGHETSYESCKQSIDIAWQFNKGPFTDIEIIAMPDPHGEQGRSKRRNDGIQHAKETNCDWIFFLDADDLMIPEAFLEVLPYIDKFDAIWGNICEMPHGDFSNVKSREHQLISTENFEDILRVDPFYTLQMGHFVKTIIALEIGFDVSMDVGEDFRYYLEICSRYKFIKCPEIFFINQRGNHSIGPRSANGAQWRNSVESEISKFKIKAVAKTKKLILENGSIAVVVAHPDDEVLWAGGLLARIKGVDVIVCSIPFKDPERIICFCRALKHLGHHPIILPFYEQSASTPLTSLKFLKLNEYQTIFTHNAYGEYGHLHHQQVHTYVKENFQGTKYYFGYGFGDRVLALSQKESMEKLNAIKYYDNKPNNFKGLETWQVLLQTLKVDFDFEWYIQG